MLMPILRLLKRYSLAKRMDEEDTPHPWMSNAPNMVSRLRDFSKSFKELEPTVCALCGERDPCDCYIHPPHNCRRAECECGDGCVCCEVDLCDCEVKDG